MWLTIAVLLQNLPCENTAALFPLSNGVFVIISAEPLRPEYNWLWSFLLEILYLHLSFKKFYIYILPLRNYKISFFLFTNFISTLLFQISDLSVLASVYPAFVWSFSWHWHKKASETKEVRRNFFKLQTLASFSFAVPWAMIMFCL